jgi:hypothetical protein
MTGSVSRDVGYHCDFTGSTKRWTKWPLWIRTGYAYETSPIEEFLAKNHPDLVEHKWVIYDETGRNIFGQPVSSRHGHPNALLFFPRKYLKLYVDQTPKEDVIELYKMLCRDNRDEIQLRMDRLYDERKGLVKKLTESHSSGD